MIIPQEPWYRQLDPRRWRYLEGDFAAVNLLVLEGITLIVMSLVLPEPTLVLVVCHVVEWLVTLYYMGIFNPFLPEDQKVEYALPTRFIGVQGPVT